MIPARLTVLILAFCWTLPSPLQAAPVRALEHPEFSRLLLPVPPDVDWSLQRDRRSARLELRGPVPLLDLDGIFDRMPRSRIRSVATTVADDGATLRIDLGCDCDLVVERLGETLLAVDVRSPDGGAAAAASGPVAGPRLEEAPSGMEQAGAASAPAESDDPPEPMRAARNGSAAAPGGSGTAIEPAADTRPEGAKFLSVPPATGSAEDGADRTGDRVLPAVDDPVRRARDALVRQLERAAEDGLVELAPDAAETARALTAARPEPMQPEERLPKTALLPRLTPAPAPGDRRILNPSSEPEEPGPEPAQPLAGETPPPPESAAGARTEPNNPEAAAADLLAHLVAREPVAEPPTKPVAGNACPPDEALDVRLWPRAGGDLIGALGEMRRALYSESGRLERKAVRDLARLYITVGFGREAATLLETSGLATDAEPLHDLSMLVEGRPAPAGGAVLAAESCTGRVLMWRAVAGAEPLDPDATAWPMIRDGLMELPPRLRRLVGQELARQALLGDRPGAARELIDLLDRTPGAEPRMETRVRAALAVSRGETEYALTLIAPEIQNRASPDPEALLLHARATLAGSAPPDPAVMTMLDTAIPGYDIGAPVGRALRLVRARLEAAAGRPGEALDMVQRVLAASGGTNADAIETGREILAGLPADQRRGPVGARMILAHRNLLDGGAESRGLRLDFADALIDGGLPNAALKLLAAPRVLRDREMRLVAARAQLVLGENDEVFHLLDGLSGAAAARIRASAYRRAGNMAAAHAELATLDEADVDRNATALLAREWEGVNPDVIAAPYAPLAAYAAEQARADAGPGRERNAQPAIKARPSLIEAQAALTQARRLREAFGVKGPEG